MTSRAQTTAARTRARDLLHCSDEALVARIARGDGPAFAERYERLEAALATIPDCERELIELAYFEGYTQSELATRLGLPLGTVKRRTFNTLARLRGQLEGER